MSKSTKIIAGLGVAAALGVAALPVASYATAYKASVDVSADIVGTLAMYINSSDESVTDGFIKATETGVEGDAISFGTDLATGKQYVASDTTTLKVTTNEPAGYTLDAAATALANTSGQTIGLASAKTITNNGTVEDTDTTSVWGINATVSGNKTALDAASKYTSAENTFTAIAESATAGDNLLDQQTSVSGNITNTYTIKYGLSVAAGQASGTYEGSINYIATSLAE